MAALELLGYGLIAVGALAWLCAVHSAFTGKRSPRPEWCENCRSYHARVMRCARSGSLMAKVRAPREEKS